MHKKKEQKICTATILMLIMTAVLSIAAFGQEEAGTEAETQGTAASWEEHIPELDGLTFEKQMDFKYVQCVDIYYYEGGYKFFDVYDSGQYLLVPEGGEIPADLDKNVTIIQKPLSNVYMAATAVMALVNAVDGLDQIRFSSLEKDGWYVEDAAQAMENGDAGRAGQ